MSGNKGWGGSNSICIIFLNWVLPQTCLHHYANERQEGWTIEGWFLHKLCQELSGLCSLLQTISWTVWVYLEKQRDLACFFLSSSLLGHCLTSCCHILYILQEKVNILFFPLQKCYMAIIENTE